MSKLWTPPKHIYRGGPDPEIHGQMTLPGTGESQARPPHGRYVKPGSDLYRQGNNPHVWGTLAGEHNPFHHHDLGDSTEYNLRPNSVDDWEQQGHEGFDDAKQHLQKIVNKSHPVIRIHEEALHSVLKEGRVKSQFETKTSRGMLSNGTRAHHEHNWFGYPSRHAEHDDYDYDEDEENEHSEDTEHPSHGRPIYGFLATNPHGRDNADQYGDHKLVLHKPSIWHRTTMNFGDSLHNPQVAPSAVQDASPYSFHSEHRYPDESLHHTVKTLRHLDPSNGDTARHGVGWQYAEAQFHGGVHRNDIHYAILNGYNHNDQLKESLNHHGIPWVEHGDRLGQQVVDHSGGSTKEALFNRVTLAVESYIRLMASHSMGQVMVVAQQGTHLYLLSESGDPQGTVRIADTKKGTLSQEHSLQSLLARGYWEDPEPGVNAEGILALVKP